MSEWFNIEEKLPKIGDLIEIDLRYKYLKIELMSIYINDDGFQLKNEVGDTFVIKLWRPIPKSRKVTLEFFKFEEVMPETNRQIFVKSDISNDLPEFNSNRAAFWRSCNYKEWAYVPEEMMGERD